MPYADPEVQAAYMRQWVAKRRAAYFADKSCTKCGSTDRLELDHIDNEAKVRPSDHAIWSWSAARRAEELAKCQVLCHTHHLEKTALQRPRWSHGITGYNRHGCKCDICRAAKSASNARRRR